MKVNLELSIANLVQLNAYVIIFNLCLLLIKGTVNYFTVYSFEFAQ